VQYCYQKGEGGGGRFVLMKIGYQYGIWLRLLLLLQQYFILPPSASVFSRRPVCCVVDSTAPGRLDNDHRYPNNAS
jgi:hypothetical protein